MDDDVRGVPPSDGARPMTRRELRLAAAAAERAREEAAAEAEVATTEAEVAVAEPAQDQLRQEPQDQSEHQPEAALEAQPEPQAPSADAQPPARLPATVVDEPEDDDVRWYPGAPAGSDTATEADVVPRRSVGTWPGPSPATMPDVFSAPATGTTVGETEPVPRLPVPVPVPVPEPASVPEPPSADGRMYVGTREEPADDLPTLDDLLARRDGAQDGPAEMGWRAGVRRATGGLVRLPPAAAERRRREDVAAVRRELDGPRTVVVVNPKGGAHKTTATLLLAATFGMYRSGYTLAWDNNETRGTLGWRSRHGRHTRTAVDLLRDLDRFDDPAGARVGDLDAYVRAQPAGFDVLASDEDAASAASIDGEAFGALHTTLARFYRVMVVDTGNNMRASNWQAALDVADQVVFVTTVREDTAQSAAWAVDALRATGHEDAVRRAVTVLADPAVERDRTLGDRLHDHFGRLTRAVVDVPYDAALVAGGPLEVESLAPRTREAWLRATAEVARGL